MTIKILLQKRAEALAREDRNEYTRISKQIYYRRHPEQVQATTKKWKECNPRRVELVAKQWARDNKDAINKRNKKWRAKNPEWVKRYFKDRWLNSPYYRMKSRYDGRTKEFFRQGCMIFDGIPKSCAGRPKRIFCLDLCGCTELELYAYLRNVWFDGCQLDHIKPCHLFNLEDMEQVKKCYHYTNLRFISKEENQRKGRAHIEESLNAGDPLPQPANP